ncbi:hypothetical protein GCM10027044_08980 [Hymenobacter ruber]
MRHQAAEGVREVGVNLLGAGESKCAGWGVVGALLGEFAGKVLVFELDLLNGDDGGGGLGAVGAYNGQKLRHKGTGIWAAGFGCWLLLVV